jgi:hypothetical protein
MEPAHTPLPLLVTAYLRHHRTRDRADFWAFDEVKDRVLWNPDPAAAWELVLALVRAADDDSLGYVGAGPLEDLVTAHGVSLIQEIEHEAMIDPRFQACLARVWLSEGELPPDILERVVRASGGAIEPLPPLSGEDEA